MQKIGGLYEKVFYCIILFVFCDAILLCGLQQQQKHNQAL